MAENKKRAEAAPRKMAVEVQGDIRRRLRVFVAGQDVTVKKVVNEALDDYLKKRGA